MARVITGEEIVPAKIFVSYRRDDDPSAAARLRDGLAAKFGKDNLFMDVDNLLAGFRFDEELAKALATSDVAVELIEVERSKTLDLKKLGQVLFDANAKLPQAPAERKQLS